MVVPSISYENAPMALLEAASLGIPSVASDIGGIPELVDDGVTGLLFPPGDARSLATALEGLAVDRELATSLGRNAWKRVRSAHDPQRYLHALLVGYAEVADRDLRRIPSAVRHGRPSRVSVAHRPE
jgi:glycosyltransferase involved in cell wall biosynthesis